METCQFSENSHILTYKKMLGSHEVFLFLLAHKTKMETVFFPPHLQVIWLTYKWITLDNPVYTAYFCSALQLRHGRLFTKDTRIRLLRLKLLAGAMATIM